MSIALISRVFARDGAEAALATARAAQASTSIIRALEDGTFTPGFKSADKPKEVHLPLGRKGDVSLFAVKRAGDIVRIVKQTRGESGNIVAEALDTLVIAEAMKIIL